MRWFFIALILGFLCIGAFMSGIFTVKETPSVMGAPEGAHTTTSVLPETRTPNPVLFGSFLPKCSAEVTDLTDSRLIRYYNIIGVVDLQATGRKMTRAEFLKLLLNSANVDVSMEADPKYLDVSSTHTLKKYIAYAERNNIVGGQDAQFRPDEPISRAEVAKILVLSAGLSPASMIPVFADVDSGNLLAGYIEQAFESCMLHGRQTVGGAPIGSGRIFEPNDGITLAEAIKTLYNINH